MASKENEKTSEKDEVEGTVDGDIKEFDLEALYIHFKRAIVDSETRDLRIEDFIKGYQQIYILFGTLGRLFTFMSSDVAEKMKIITEKRISTGEHAANYRLLSTMLTYEAEVGLAPTKSKNINSGVRAYTRLHRGMAFIVELFIRLADAGERDPAGPIAKAAYDKTLAHFHPWLIQKGVSVAVHTLPYNLPLATTLKIVPPDATVFEDERRQRVRAVAEVVRTAHEIGEELLRKGDCLNLP